MRMRISELKEKLPLELAQVILDAIEDIKYYVKDTYKLVPIVENIVLTSGYNTEHLDYCVISFCCEVVTAKYIHRIQNSVTLQNHFLIPNTYYDN